MAKKIVVTGATGFIGRYLLNLLKLDSSCEVLALSRRKTYSQDSSYRNLSFAQTDYSERSLEALLSGAIAVVHLAGNKGALKHLVDYKEDFEMTENILKAAVKNDIKRIIYASSRLVYGNPDNIPWKEESIPEPRCAYGANKIRCENLCKQYSEKYDIETIIVRIAQVLGEGDTTKNMINVFQNLAKEKGELKVIGKSIAKRQYIYAGNLADILQILIKMNSIGSFIVNAGMREAYTNLEIAEIINHAYRNDTPIKHESSKNETITSSIMDISFLVDKIGYLPMDMEQSLKEMLR